MDSTMVALSGGEDYELLFTVSVNDFDKITKDFQIQNSKKDTDAAN
jgi:thiamine monophosphate kinase